MRMFRRAAPPHRCGSSASALAGGASTRYRPRTPEPPHPPVPPYLWNHTGRLPARLKRRHRRSRPARAAPASLLTLQGVKDGYKDKSSAARGRCCGRRHQCTGGRRDAHHVSGHAGGRPARRDRQCVECGGDLAGASDRSSRRPRQAAAADTAHDQLRYRLHPWRRDRRRGSCCCSPSGCSCCRCRA